MMARRNPEKHWVMGHFKMTIEDVASVMEYWQDDWKVDLPYAEISDSDS